MASFEYETQYNSAVFENNNNMIGIKFQCSAGKHSGIIVEFEMMVRENGYPGIIYSVWYIFNFLFQFNRGPWTVDRGPWTMDRTDIKALDE